MKHLKTYSIFESQYYDDDLNVDITSTIAHIFEDLTDGTDFDVNCFTVGYETLKGIGATHTDNDIHFSIIREYYDYECYPYQLKQKTFTLDQIIPYFKRMFDYIKSEGLFIKDIHYQFRTGGKVRSPNKLNYVECTVNELLEGGNFPIESIAMYFSKK